MEQAIGAGTLRTYRTAGSTRLYVAAGVRWGFRRSVTVTPRGKLKVDRASRPDAGDAGSRDPAKYLWLVTHGRKAVAAKDRKILYDGFSQRFLGRSVAAAEPNPFIERTYESIAPRARRANGRPGCVSGDQPIRKLATEHREYSPCPLLPAFLTVPSSTSPPRP